MKYNCSYCWYYTDTFLKISQHMATDHPKFSTENTGIPEELTNHTNRRDMHSPFTQTPTTQEALSVDQQIRIAALNASAIAFTSHLATQDGAGVITIAKAYEHYIKTGEPA